MFYKAQWKIALGNKKDEKLKLLFKLLNHLICEKVFLDVPKLHSSFFVWHFAVLVYNNEIKWGTKVNVILVLKGLGFVDQKGVWVIKKVDKSLTRFLVF